MLTPKVDPNDDLFGHVHTWVTHLARRVERLDVLALWAGRPPLPENVRFASLGKGDGAGATRDKLLCLGRLQRLVGRLCLRREVDAVLAHMGPIFAVAAAPAARLTDRPLFLWYAHGHVSPMLRLAHALVDGVGTSTPEGFRIPSSKVTITGQGIDTERFRPAEGGRNGRPTVLSVGRFSPIKDYGTLLDAVARLPDPRPEVEVVGGAHSPREVVYLARLRAAAERLGLDGEVCFRAGVPHAEIVPTYRRATVFASCSRTGSLDKAVLEAAACGVAPLVCNDAFREPFGPDWAGLSFPPGDPDALADRLADWIGRGDADRREVALRLREVVVREHGVGHLADRLVEMIVAGTAGR